MIAVEELTALVETAFDNREREEREKGGMRTGGRSRGLEENGFGEREEEVTVLACFEALIVSRLEFIAALTSRVDTDVGVTPVEVVFMRRGEEMGWAMTGIGNLSCGRGRLPNAVARGSMD